ncbi:MAG: thioredoxin [Planctomycetota bacterium]
MSALHINDTNFQAEVLDSSQTTLVDFWAPWCGPCRMMGEVVDELADEVGDDAVVAKVNIDEAPETALSYGITSIPTFAVIQDGKITSRFSGVVDKETLKRALAV